jgi:poly(beta-D-mannuronate) lyase
MRIAGISLGIALACSTSIVTAQELINPGFEMGWAGWTDVDPNKDATSISGHYLNGIKSAKITKDTGRFEQKARLLEGSEYELVGHVKGPGTIGLEISGEVLSASSEGNGEEWIEVRVPFSTGEATQALVFGSHNGDQGRFDDFEFVALSGPALDAAIARAAGPRVYTTIPDGCDRMSQLRIKKISDDGTSDPVYGPVLAIDHDFQPESRV